MSQSSALQALSKPQYTSLFVKFRLVDPSVLPRYDTISLDPLNAKTANPTYVPFYYLNISHPLLELLLVLRSDDSLPDRLLVELQW